MKPKFVTVHLARGSDGDRREWDIGYYKDATTAGKVSQENWGTPREKLAIDVGGKLYPVVSEHPIEFVEDVTAAKESALSKLTADEIRLLGIKVKN